MPQLHEADLGGPATKRQANVAARRRRILGAAQDLIHSEGLAALSMRRLAAEADLSVTTLYNLFGDKEGVVVAMIDATLDELELRLDAVAPADLEPFGRCRAVITVSIEHLAGRPEVHRPVILAALERMARGEPDDRRFARRAADMLTQGLAAARDQSLLRPGTNLAALASQIYHGYELAEMQWAHGRLGVEAFEARALYGLWIALLAVCNESERPQLERELATTTDTLRANDADIEPANARPA